MKDFQGTEYRKLCKEVTKACRRAKRSWLRGICSEAEDAAKKGNTRQVYRLIKKVSKKKNVSSGLGVKDEEGNMIFDKEGIKERWFRYGKKLFKSETTRLTIIPPAEREPNILLSEIREAVRKLANNKAPGMDGVAGEMLKAGGETVITGLKGVIDRIWQTGVWPDDWAMSEMILLPKVHGAQECEKHRTISLISHASKVLIEILRRRTANFVHPEISEEQFGFMPGKGTTDAILTLRNIIEKTLVRQEQVLWILFVDYTKAFDSVDHRKLWEALDELGVPHHLTWLIQNLYGKAVGKIKVDQDYTGMFPFERGVRQGCPLSPLLFNACGEVIMRRVEEELDDLSGITIGGRRVWNLRYADDTALLAKNKEELEKFGEALRRHSDEFGLKINMSKTFAMVWEVSDSGRLNLEGEEIQVVERCKYLGSTVTSKGDSEQEIRTRLAMARAVVVQLAEVWKGSEIGKGLKVRLMKTLVWTVARYGSESWTLKKEDERRIGAFEMWAWRRMLRVSWRAHKTNVWIREKVGVKEEDGLLEKVKEGKLRKYGHWKRRPDSLVTATIEGEVQGRAKRGRRRRGWIEDIAAWTDGGLQGARRMAWRREKVSMGRRRPTAND